MVKGKVFIIDMREAFGGESRAEGERSRLNSTSGLDLAMRESGAERGQGERECETESEKERVMKMKDKENLDKEKLKVLIGST